MTKKSKDNKPIQSQNQSGKTETTMNEPTEGIAKFESMPQESFRFCVEQQQGTEGKIWLENKTSKKQWECEVKSIADFAPENIVIPLETVLGYVESCLKSSTKAAVDRNFEADLVKNPEKKGELVLEVMFKFGISGFSWTPTYKFPMKEVAVLEIDILRSQLQDQREELDELKKRFDDVRRKDSEAQQLTTRLANAEARLDRAGYY